jgi:hypothetical protein
MMKIIGTFLLGMAMSVQAQANEGSVTIREGFLKGDEYLHMSNSDKANYAMGFVDALLVSPLLDAPENKVEWIGRCVVGMSNKKLVGIFDKYLRAHPDQRSQSSNILLFSALSEACPHG